MKQASVYITAVLVFLLSGMGALADCPITSIYREVAIVPNGDVNNLIVLDLCVGDIAALKLSVPVQTIAIGNPKVAAANMVNQTTMLLTGLDAGVTSVAILNATGTEMATVSVRVAIRSPKKDDMGIVLAAPVEGTKVELQETNTPPLLPTDPSMMSEQQSVVGPKVGSELKPLSEDMGIILAAPVEGTKVELQETNTPPRLPTGPSMMSEQQSVVGPKVGSEPKPLSEDMGIILAAPVEGTKVELQETNTPPRLPTGPSMMSEQQSVVGPKVGSEPKPLSEEDTAPQTEAERLLGRVIIWRGLNMTVQVCRPDCI